MASINGISIKGMNTFLGHEGEPLCQGDVYLDNRELGFWSQDSWGGPDRFNFSSQFSKHLLDQAVIARNPEKAFHGTTGDRSYVIEYDLEHLLGDCVELIEEERTYKEAVKSGYAGILLATDGFHQTTWSLPPSYTRLSDEELLSKLASAIEKAKEGFWPENDTLAHKVKIYRSLDDFEIGDPIDLQEILVKKDLSNALNRAKTDAEIQTLHSSGVSTEKERS